MSKKKSIWDCCNNKCTVVNLGKQSPFSYEVSNKEQTSSEFLNGKLYAHESAFSVQGTESLLYRIGFSMQLVLFQQQKLCKYRPISCKRTWSICSRVLRRSVTADGFRACSAPYTDIYNNGVQGDMSCICKKTREAWKHIWIHPINKCSLSKHDENVAGHVWWDTEYTRRLLHLEDESLSMERNFQSVNWVAHFLSWEVKKRHSITDTFTFIWVKTDMN